MVARRRKSVVLARSVSALTARTQFGQILRRVRHNHERFVVDRRGEPQAVILGVEEYLRNFAKETPELRRIRVEAKANNLERLTLREINAEIRKARKAMRRAHGQRRS